MNRLKDQGKAEWIHNRMLDGLIAATPIPFDANGRLHEAAHQSYLRYMASQPISGVAVWAHTGRGLMLDVKTAQRVLRDWREALPEKLVIAGVGSLEPSSHRATLQTLEMADRAASLGADAILCYPPTWLRENPNRDHLILEHHRKVAEVGLPLILFYLYEAAGGIAYSQNVLDELLALPNVVGIKMATLDSVMTYQDVSRRVEVHHQKTLLITGEDRFLGYSLRRGARAALIGMGAICCELQAELISANAQGEAADFLAKSDEVDRLAETIFVAPMEGYIKRLLWALVHLGVIPFEAANDPWGPQLAIDEFHSIARTLDELVSVEQGRGA